MGIVSQTFGLLGQTGVTPRRVQMVSTDSLATITAAGYLTENGLVPNTVYPTDIVDCIYSYNPATTSGTLTQLTPTIVQGVITLNVSNVDSAVTIDGNAVAGNVAVFGAGATQIQDLGIVNTNLMQINQVNTLTAAGSIVAHKADGTESGNAVTASGMAGLITTSSLTTAGGSSYAITWTNTFISNTSVVLLTIAGGTNTTENITLKVVPGSGTATLTIYNNTTATALNGTIFISYLVI